MTWRIELRPAVVAEIDDAAEWYEGRAAGLGREFVREVNAAIATLHTNASLPRLRHRTKGVRWIFPRRFPYRIVYRIEAESVVIMALLHAARSDVAWRERK